MNAFGFMCFTTGICLSIAEQTLNTLLQPLQHVFFLTDFRFCARNIRGQFNTNHQVFHFFHPLPFYATPFFPAFFQAQRKNAFCKFAQEKTTK